MPSDGKGTRLLRTALLANELTNRGHEVVYWNATFNHQKKLQRYRKSRRVLQNDAYDAIFLHGRAYARNVSLARIRSQKENADEFSKLAPKEPRPDVILCGFPPIELAYAAMQFAKKECIPFAIDCRDMWPDIFAEQLPTALRKLAKLAFQHWERQKVETMRFAAALTGITSEFVKWGLDAAQRPPAAMDQHFHLAVSPEVSNASEIAAARAYWDSALGDREDGCIIVCFAGTLSGRLDLDTVLDAAKMFSESEKRKVRIVLCGNGDLKDRIETEARDNPVLLYGGWRNKAELAALMEMSDFGLLPYPNTRDFLASFPNKVGEYLLAGLPVLTGLGGATDRILTPRGLKVSYNENNASSLVHAIRRQMGNKDRLGARANAEMLGRENFDPKSIYPAFADWLEHVPSKGQLPQ